MIPSAHPSKAKENPKSHLSDWDLNSSLTGTVKRRPSSPTAEYPIDSTIASTSAPGQPPRNPNDVKSSKTVNAANEMQNLSQEIVQGNCLIDAKGSSRCGSLINFKNSANSKGAERKRFFDSKSSESSPGCRISGGSSSSSSSGGKPISNISSLKSKLKLPKSLNLSPRKNSQSKKLAQLEKQNNLFIRDGLGTEDIISCPLISKKSSETNLSSLIPSFLGGSSKSFKLPQSQSNPNSNCNSPAKTSNNASSKFVKFKELYRDFPSNHSDMKPPPYREPPPPSPAVKKKARECEIKNYEEIDELEEEKPHKAAGSNSNHEHISTATVNTKAIIHIENLEKFAENKKTQELAANSNINVGMEAPKASEEPIEIFYNELEIDSDEEMLARPEFSSKMFENLPIRAKKGAVPHMDNYCLFDPSVDFFNEKEHRKKGNMEPQASTSSQHHHNNSHNSNFLIENLKAIGDEEIIEDIMYEDQLVYDILEDDSREKLALHHNYYVIDPDLLEEDEQAQQKNIAVTSKRTREAKTYSNISSTSSSSTSTSSASNKFSTTTDSSTDHYPSFNHNSQDNLPEPKIEEEKPKDDGARKKQPQIDKIFRGSVNNRKPVNTRQAPSSFPAKPKPKSNLPFYKPTGKTDALNITIDNSTTIQVRKQIFVQRQRPLSNHSDADSGFLSPNTSPDANHPTNAPKANVESNLLRQCDNIQELIEVSDSVMKCAKRT